MKIKYSLESIVDLQRVVEFVEVKNPFAARRIAIDLQEGVDKLKLFPKIGLPVLKAPDPEQIRDLYIAAFFKIVVTVSFMRPEPVGWPIFPG
ncbi:MAG: type II toxin-antitoxin system RelE/ParE family toxin [Gammaproteobacteria bacterium]|nr:type II toxin-antitoxin system RelE/ParE family toxin [Gammaproteobacteria bacterium]